MQKSRWGISIKGLQDYLLKMTERSQLLSVGCKGPLSYLEEVDEVSKSRNNTRIFLAAQLNIHYKGHDPLKGDLCIIRQ